MSFDSVSIPGPDRTPRQSQPAESSNGFFDFLEGVGKGAAVKPAAGLIQIADKALGGLYDVQENGLDGKIVSLAQEEPSSIWENGGQMVGMIAPFIVARGGARFAGARISSAVEASRFASMAPRLSPTAVAASNKAPPASRSVL